MENFISFFEKISKSDTNERKNYTVSDRIELAVYPHSIRQQDKTTFFIGTLNKDEKFLWILYESKRKHQWSVFAGEDIVEDIDGGNWNLKRCPFSHVNATQVKRIFPHTKPITLGVCNTIGLGDRVGMAGAGQLRVVRKTKMRPVLAQQSTRELRRTNRSPNDVINAAVWAALQEGYEDGFAADADHLKTKEDIDFMAPAGFTIYTIDPSEHIDNRVDIYSDDEIKEKIKTIPWSDIKDNLNDCINRYCNQPVKIGDDLIISPTQEDLLIVLVKYANAIVHTYQMYHYLKKTITHAFEMEVSIDESDSVTTPFQHFFFAQELKRLKVPFVSLAPRFVGTFEKGVDYRGDLELFAKQYQDHARIAQFLGPYKVSIHSASEKYSVFDAISKHQDGFIHVKTTGTTYLVAMMTICMAEPDLFREIYDFARERFLEDLGTYHVSARPEDLPKSADLTDEELLGLFERGEVRQVLYVPYGSVLSAKDDRNRYRFRERIFNCLLQNEYLHYKNISINLIKHVPSYLVCEPK